MDRVSAIMSFVKVVDDGGFAAAARQLNLSSSAVTTQIKSLEDRLGIRLHNRSPRSVSLAVAGRACQSRAPRAPARVRSTWLGVKGALTGLSSRVGHQSGRCWVMDIEWTPGGMATVARPPLGREPSPWPFGLETTVRARSAWLREFITSAVSSSRILAEIEQADEAARMLQSKPRGTRDEPHGRSHRRRRPTQRHHFYVFKEPKEISSRGYPETTKPTVRRPCGLRHCLDRACFWRHCCFASELKSGVLVPLLAEFLPEEHALYPHRDHLPAKVRA
jgi:hypothetical protein